MKKRSAFVLGGFLIAVSGAAAFATVFLRTQEASAVSDPRQELAEDDHILILSADVGG